MSRSCENEFEGLYSAQPSPVMIVLDRQGDKAMRDGDTYRVCPSCGAVDAVERVTCDHCGSLTVRKVTRGIKSEEPQQDGPS
jgi:hypothetical protein